MITAAMVNSAQIDHTRSYLDAHFNHGGPTKRARLALPFITISREAGSGGSALAHHLCQRLNGSRDEESPEWSVVDRNLVERLLEEKQLSHRLARFLPEDRVPELTAAIGELVGLHPNLWKLRDDTNTFIRQLASVGHVILVGRGAVFATAGLPQGIHVRTMGSHLGRAERAAAALGLSIPAALAHNRKADAASRKYVRSLFNTDPDDPHIYDLIVNTDRVPAAEAADHVVAVLQTRARAESTPAPVGTRPSSSLQLSSVA